MNRDVQTSPSKAPLSRRTKKTVPKPSMDLTPPPRQCRNAEHEEIEEEKKEKQSGFQLASGLTDVENVDLSTDNLEVAYLNETEDEDDKMLLGSPQNYRRLKSCTCSSLVHCSQLKSNMCWVNCMSTSPEYLLYCCIVYHVNTAGSVHVSGM